MNSIKEKTCLPLRFVEMARRIIRQYSCDACEKALLSKDEIGVCKKLLGKDTAHFYCLDCLAQYLECEVDELKAKIAQFKADGCKLFR